MWEEVGNSNMLGTISANVLTNDPIPELMVSDQNYLVLPPQAD